jgi:hypothetical protein
MQSPQQTPTNAHDVAATETIGRIRTLYVRFWQKARGFRKDYFAFEPVGFQNYCNLRACRTDITHDTHTLNGSFVASAHCCLKEERNMPGNKIAVIQRLAAKYTDRFGWLSAFDTPIDDLITQDLKANAQSAQFTYDPFLFEDLLASASSRLDVCLTRRRDAMDLLDKAVRLALDEELYQATQKADTDIDKSNSVEAQANATSKGATSAIAAYGSASLEKGLAASAQGVVDASTDMVARDKSRQAALTAKATAQAGYHKEMVDYSNTPGHPLNYAERTARVFTLLIDDVREAYEKLLAVRTGLDKVWGVKLDPIEFIDTDQASDPISQNGTISGWEPGNTLDGMVIWARNASRSIEAQTSREIMITLNIPLLQPYSLDGAAAPKALDTRTPAALFGAADDQKALFSFTIDQTALLGLSNPRLLGISAAIASGGPAGTHTNEGVAVRVVVDAPARPADVTMVTPPLRTIVLGSVPMGVAAGTQLFEASPAIRNCDPCGQWRVNVLRGMLSCGNASQFGRNSYISDVQIFLRVAGQMKQTAG